MAYTNPSVSDFKSYFNRDFPYGTDIDTSVTDGDITKAMEQTFITINQAFFNSQQAYNVGYYLLSAHNLVMNLRASSQGINGQASWLQQSHGAGSVNESFAIPQQILNNPLYSILTKTNYGMQYLNMVLPYLTGVVGWVPGRTLP